MAARSHGKIWAQLLICCQDKPGKIEITRRLSWWQLLLSGAMGWAAPWT